MPRHSLTLTALSFTIRKEKKKVSFFFWHIHKPCLQDTHLACKHANCKCYYYQTVNYLADKTTQKHAIKYSIEVAHEDTTWEEVVSVKPAHGTKHFTVLCPFLQNILSSFALCSTSTFTDGLMLKCLLHIEDFCRHLLRTHSYINYFLYV